MSTTVCILHTSMCVCIYVYIYTHTHTYRYIAFITILCTPHVNGQLKFPPKGILSSFSLANLSLNPSNYSRPLNNMGFNCMGTLTPRFFSRVDATVLHYPQLVKSTDAEPQIWRNQGYRRPTINCTQIFDCREGQSPDPLRCSGVNCIAFSIQLKKRQFVLKIKMMLYWAFLRQDAGL